MPRDVCAGLSRCDTLPRAHVRAYCCAKAFRRLTGCGLHPSQSAPRTLRTIEHAREAFITAPARRRVESRIKILRNFDARRVKTASPPTPRSPRVLVTQ